ncbi:AAA domain-containing protein [Streptomyces bambusae]|uniref:DEAD/DEAH box helicase n=1 Tax=Streptomyces bambusae TaxID=1550616 RepID=UPI001CFCB480|nr:AAA domain-containing protein [Streptomyces bambusae]MCB5165812.1 AAA domain-containing protein [Streptomyces bambusae]
MGGERGRRAAVVAYWRAVELFSPQKVPAAAPRERVYAVDDDRPLPWQDGHPLRGAPLEDGHVWQHVVYGGVYALTAVRDTLLGVFGGSAEDHDGRMDGESALFALTVSDEGRPLRDSAVFSSCAWATGRALAPGPGSPGWLDGFGEACAAWTARAGELLDEKAKMPADGTGPLITDPAQLHDLVREVAEDWGVTGALAPREVRIRSVAVRADRVEDADHQDFLNSFVAADLERVAADLARTDPGPGLTAYLTPHAALDTARRTDVREHPQTVLDGVAPRRTPPGRWPAPADHPLALSQQFAVNAIAEALPPGQGGIFAVNGPPGTGKTTMLRDCFAAAVVERAHRLSALRLPSQAFADQPPYVWKSGDYTRTVTALRPEFTGFEMIVASANNGAVENISTEIPARAALGEAWRHGADYFAEQATRLLKGAPAWGAVAARLGSRRNRIEFVNRFWHGKYRRTDAGAPAVPAQTARRGARDRGRDTWLESGNGLAHILREWRDTSQSGVWREARQRFQEAWDDVERLRTARVAVAEALAGQAAADEAVLAARTAVAAAAGDLLTSREVLAAAEAALPGVQEALADTEEEHGAHLARRPGFTVSLFTLGRAARDWHGAEAELMDRVAAARAARDGVRRQIDRARRTMAEAQNRLHAAEDAGAAARRYADGLTACVAAGRARWGGHVPDAADGSAATADARELSAPWADPELTRARSALFLAALDLHQAFLRCTARTMYQNLMGAMDAVAGAVPPTVPEAHLRAAWQALFLVVPVVSTTFASLDRVFTGLGSEALGTLYVDEAGQAAPQLAVGGIWRARRTVVVGDPLQLEPVVVLPWTAQRALREDFATAEEWSPGRTSVQQLADRTTRYGTLLPAELPDGSREAWVGAPLRVHRRCDDPMFGISNRIAYDGLMVQGTTGRAPYPYGPASSWVDVVSAQADGHWVPEEGRALRRVLERLRDEGGVDLARDVFVISPFRAVVEGAKLHCRDLMPVDRVGTVHTTQGKEADVVVLVLGTDPRSPGARAWAASRPNLLNVAVSRARRRLFVIGNREVWRDQRFFSELADALPAHTWQLQHRRG